MARPTRTEPLTVHHVPSCNCAALPPPDHCHLCTTMPRCLCKQKNWLIATHLLGHVCTQAFLFPGCLHPLLCRPEAPRPLLVHFCSRRHTICMCTPADGLMWQHPAETIGLLRDLSSLRLESDFDRLQLRSSSTLMPAKLTDGHVQQLAGPHDAKQPVHVFKHPQEHLRLCRGGRLHVQKHMLGSCRPENAPSPEQAQCPADEVATKAAFTRSSG